MLNKHVEVSGEKGGKFSCLLDDEKPTGGEALVQLSSSVLWHTGPSHFEEGLQAQAPPALNYLHTPIGVCAFKCCCY